MAVRGQLRSAPSSWRAPPDPAARAGSLGGQTRSDGSREKPVRLRTDGVPRFRKCPLARRRRIETASSASAPRFMTRAMANGRLARRGPVGFRRRGGETVTTAAVVPVVSWSCTRSVPTTLVGVEQVQERADRRRAVQRDADRLARPRDAAAAETVRKPPHRDRHRRRRSPPRKLDCSAQVWAAALARSVSCDEHPIDQRRQLAQRGVPASPRPSAAAIARKASAGSVPARASAATQSARRRKLSASGTGSR